MNPSAPQTLLIIDDEPHNLRLIVETLRDYGFRLMTAGDGTVGLELAQRGQPDLILLDYRMPPPDGFEVCRRLKADAQTRDIPVIFLSALNEVDNKLEGFKLGALDYLNKPIDPRELLARITAHLDRGQLQQRLLQRLQSYENQTDESPQQRLQHIKNLTAYLLDHLDIEHNLDDLARMAHSNRASLNEHFNHLFGTSVFDWLHEQRMQHAASLLIHSTRQIQQIAFNVGYNNSTAFSTAFKRRFGLSPREYRARQA